MDTPDKPVHDSDKVFSITETVPDTRTVNELNQSKIESLTEELQRLKKERDDLKAMCAALRTRIETKKKEIVPTSVDWRSLSREMDDRMSEAVQRWILLSEEQ
ncbi:hypothetical protein CGLO_01868 [Colletotrichum gloeosporioides Cg-14]|uniref:Uncharacterized protein n=1 Tax=Colletotrichum gloeosporioides (strain Cg-14) TaxID=1237896 RepID=T0M335_COLGC|nr:hypothetical protein CGLO_01868 [Colletotrichum gloeosporioides Cg-14]